MRYAEVIVLALLFGLMVWGVLTLVRLPSPWPLFIGWILYGTLVQHLHHIISFDSALYGVHVTATVFCVTFIVVVAIAAARGSGPASLTITWGAYALLFLSLSAGVWGAPWDFLRAFTDCYVTGIMVLMLSGRMIFGYLLTLVGVVLPLILWYSAVA